MKKLLAFFLFAAPLFAQNSPVVPVQTKLTPESDPKTVYTIVLQPTRAGNMLFMYGQFGQNPTITDSQGNAWIQVNADYSDVFYVPASKGGAETITVTFPVASYFIGIDYEFQGSYILADVIQSRNLPTYGGQSLVYDTNTANPCTATLTVSNSNELVVSYFAANNLPQFSSSLVTPAPGWNLGAFVNNFFAEGTIVTLPGTIQGCVTMPMIPSGVQVTAGLAGFKPTSIPVTNQVTLSLNFSNDDGTPSTIWSVAVADTTANVQDLNLVPNPSASGTFTLSSADNYTVSLSLAGTSVVSYPYEGSLLLALFPNLSQINGTIVFCKTTCTAGAIKSANWTIE